MLIAVAALSARMMAEAAARDGFEVVALDLFGDADTRRAAAEWRSAGDPAAMRIDAARLLAALRELAARGVASGKPVGWVAGTGFEGQPHLLSHAARLLPLFGTDACSVRRLRDPATFFALLDAHRIAHPPVRFEPPADPAGWLLKDGGGSGGWHIRDAADCPGRVAQPVGHGGLRAPLPAQHYFQRALRGTPMSATFIADGTRALLLGCNELTLQPTAARRYCFAGVVGPVPVAANVLAQVEQALQVLSAGFRLRGLGSLDFLLDAGTQAVSVLEVNPRPPASLALYEGRVAGGLMAAHVAACRDGVLPALRPSSAGAGSGAGAAVMRGTQLVFAARSGSLDAAAVEAIARWPGAHDLPRAGTQVSAGEPLCSLSAEQVCTADQAEMDGMADAASAGASRLRNQLNDSAAGLLVALAALTENKMETTA